MSRSLYIRVLDAWWLTWDVYLCTVVTGVLKGYDQLLNLVLDDVEELLQGMSRRRSVAGLR